MIDPIYPTSDAIYISTRTPASDAEWRALDQTVALADAAALTAAFRDRAKWMDDAKLMVDASATAVDAVKRCDVNALVELNDALYTACVQCHQDYRPNYGRRSLPGAPAAADTPPWRRLHRRLRPVRGISKACGVLRPSLRSSVRPSSRERRS
jgi:hypothetical protein